jgi:hypothetical protein
MPKVHTVQHARKDYPDAGIKKGDTYYWWEFRFGGLHRSKNYPKPSQLTQSEFLSAVYDLNDRISAMDNSMSLEDIRSEVEGIAEEFRSRAEECEEKKSNMPDQLQESMTGELLQERADSCNELADNLEGVDIPDDSEVESDAKETAEDEIKRDQLEKPVTDEEFKQLIDDRVTELVEEKRDEVLQEIQGYTYEGQ